MTASVLPKSSVLANAFTLVGISMLPTAVGAMVGMNWLPELVTSHPWLTLIGLLAASFVGLFAIFATASSSLGIISMNGFAFIMGHVLSISLWYGLEKYSNAGALIALAAVGTAVTTIAASLYALTTKRDFIGMGGTLFAVLIGVIVMGILNAFLQIAFLGTLISMVSVVLFTVYIIHDVQSAARHESNYIIVATSLYLDILNLFASLLDLLFNGFGD